MPQLKPLPDCEGPKLECFIDDIATCDFKIVGMLGDGAHSRVWKAEINGKVYAIKTVSVPSNLLSSIVSSSNHQLVLLLPDTRAMVRLGSYR
jgi:hypothetical protein